MSGCDCSRCQTEGCVANTYCPCCLKAERDVLRAQIERVREIAAMAEAEIRLAEAAIKRVRELCDAREEEENDNGGYGKAAVVRIDYVRDVLDGGDDG